MLFLPLICITFFVYFLFQVNFILVQVKLKKYIYICIFYMCFIVINNFFIFIFSQTTQHNIQNKTKQNSDTYSTSQSSIKREGGEGKDNKNTKVTPLNNHVYSTKNTAKPQWLKAWPHDSRRCTFTWDNLQEATDPICLSTHVRCKPVLNYCLLHSCKTSNKHSLLHWTNTETRIIIKKT